jgi:diguanylate cyclase (GGDEF)-like protein
MADTKAAWQASDLVPLAERLRYMRLFRVGTAILVLMYGLLGWGSSLGPGRLALFGATAAYLLVSLGGDLLWRVSGRRGLSLFGALLITDGLYLATVSYVTGATGSPLRLLILLHVIAVALLASYRTSLKLALWHSVLLFVVFYAQDAKLLQASTGVQSAGGGEVQQISLFITVLWLVALATATFSAVNERELRRRRFDLEALAKLASELENGRNSAEVADVFLDNVVDSFGFGRTLMLGARHNVFVPMGARGMEQPTMSPPKLAPDSVIDRVRLSRTTLLVSQLDPTADAWLDSAIPGAGNLIVLPFSSEGRCIAVAVIEHSLKKGSRVERRVVTTVERFASQAALALRNAWLLEQVRELAATDALTGLANRRTFEQSLQQDLSRSARNGEPVSLLMIDIDHFKRLNDSFGHQAGDDVLRQVGAVLAAQCRRYDTAARYGGEEFAMILPGCDDHQAAVLGERVRQAIAEMTTVTAVTASIGVATSTVHWADGATLIGAADQALYEAKRSGRNRVMRATLRVARDPADTTVAS